MVFGVFRQTCIGFQGLLGKSAAKWLIDRYASVGYTFKCPSPRLTRYREGTAQNPSQGTLDTLFFYRFADTLLTRLGGDLNNG